MIASFILLRRMHSLISLMPSKYCQASPLASSNVAEDVVSASSEAGFCFNGADVLDCFLPFLALFFSRRMMMAMTVEPPTMDPMEMLIFTFTVRPDEPEEEEEEEEEETDT